MTTHRSQSATAASPGSLHRTLWRWHFYAGLFVLPFIFTLALSGSVYLFKPQIERWEEREFRALPMLGTELPSRAVEAAIAAYPGAHLNSYRLPARPNDAALVHLSLHGGDGMRDVFVSPHGTVLGSLDPTTRIVELARRIHSELLLSPLGQWLVELAACWTLVMLMTGMYLWWPRGRGPAGVLWPRRSSMLRDMHAVTGFWISGLALVLLLTGLPWTHVWGSAFRTVRSEMGWVKNAPKWNTGDIGAASPERHAHDHSASDVEYLQADGIGRLDDIVSRAATESFAFPTLVLAPGTALFGTTSPDWVVYSMTQNRPLSLSITYDRFTGREVARERFAERHVLDRIIGYGQAWHEGALFGAINQFVGLLTAVSLMTMSVTGFLMWRRRRPVGVLGAPPPPSNRHIPLFVKLAALTLALLLPLLALSLLLLWLVDTLLPRMSPRAAHWLGITS